MPPVNIQSWGIAHTRPWETSSSELVVHTTYTTPNLTGESIFTRDIVASDVTSTLVPSVRPSVLPFASEPVAAWPVRPAEATTGPEPAAQRSRSRTPIARPSTPLLRRQPNVIVTDPTRTLSVHSPPLAPPPSPIPNFSQYLGWDDDSLSSDTTPPPAQREPPVQRSVHTVVRLLFHRVVRDRRLVLMLMR